MVQRGTQTASASDTQRRLPIVPLVAAGVFAVAAVLWMVVAVPRLVKYPTDLDVRTSYEGTFTLLVNPATAAPLSAPMVLPFTIDRHMQVATDESTSTSALVQETINQRAGDVVNMSQTNAYVMDRSTMLNLADPRAFAFEPTNVVDRSGAYRMNLPFNTSTGTDLPIYNNDTGDIYPLTSDAANPKGELEGLSVLNFTAATTDVPVTPAYLAQLSKMSPLPTTMTLDQLKPHLAAAGLDVDALLAALGPRLTPADGAALASFASQPVPLEYVESVTGRTGVEPVTGAQLKVGSTESIGVRPQDAAIDPLLDVLGRYPDVPEAANAADVLLRITNGESIKLFEYTYDQTPASVATVATMVSSQRNQIRAVRIWVPAALGLAALLCLIVAAVSMFRRRVEPIDLTASTERAQATMSESMPAVDAEELTSPRPEPR